MKKVFILMMILSVVFIGILPAQGLGYGVKGGLNMAKWTGDDIDEITGEGFDQKYVTAFSVGGFLTLPLGNTLTIRPELLYTQNGAKFEYSEDDGTATISSKMNWLNIPVLAVLNVGPIGIVAGPYFDIFLSGKDKFEISYEGQTFDEEEDIESDEVQTLNYGLIFGAAYGVTDKIDVELRYSLGLNSPDKEPDDYDATWGEYEESDTKPSMIQLLINFYLKK